MGAHKDLYETRALHPIDKPIQDVEISSFDIEIDSDNRTTIVGFYDGDKYYDFGTEGEFLRFFLTKKYHRRICYAHNGSGFDFQRLLVPLNDGSVSGFDYKWFLNGAKLITGSVWRGKGARWQFSDSCRIYTGTLDSLLKSILGEDQGKQGTWDTDDYEELRKYNRIDCTGLYSLMDKIRDASSVLGFQVKPTAASCSFDYLRRQLPETLFLPTSEYFYKSYFGGRVLCLQPEHTGPGFSVDINSLYPWAMCQPLPRGKPRKITPKKGRRTGKYAWNILRTTIGFVRARVRLASRPVPPLPIVYKQDDCDFLHTEEDKDYNRRILYPAGEFDGVWAIPDLLSLDPDLDWIYIRDVYAFEGECYLEPIIRKLYAYRMQFKKTAPHLYAAVKILLNSSYGKFAERPEKSALVSWPCNDVEIIDTAQGVMVLDKHHETKIPLSRSPAIAAYITAWSRYRWHQLFDRYQHRMLYLDTDSGYMAGTPDEYEFPLGDELGDLKVEAEFDYFKSLANKVYAYRTTEGKWSVKAKGFPMGNKFSVDHKKRTIRTGRKEESTYAEAGEEFLKALEDNYPVEASRPCSFSTAKSKDVRPGDWAMVQRTFTSSPGTVRQYVKGQKRTHPPVMKWL